VIKDPSDRAGTINSIGICSWPGVAVRGSNRVRIERNVTGSCKGLMTRKSSQPLKLAASVAFPSSTFKEIN
jgi:hypothetical protein